MTDESRIVATLVINFSGRATESAGAMLLEIDDRDPPEGLNGGNTEFRPGDSPAYLLYRATTVQLTEHNATAGAIATAGGGTRDVEEVLTFSDSREASLRYPVAAGFSATWLGRSGGIASLQDQSTVVIPVATFGLLRVNYTAAFTAHRLTNVPAGMEQVLIYAVGRAI